jgi:MGT family glycosyltransferase
MGPIQELNLCCVLHELQPRADNMADEITFVGPFLVEEVRNDLITNEKLKQIFETFKPINPISLSELEVNKENSKKLIYASLGTLFNNRMHVFEKIINSVKALDKNKIELVISVGKEMHQAFEKKINNGEYELPDNVLILPSVPQIEILKRASLFITHAGMNSTSETIHYGVPVICLPIQADQPLNAIRVCDELKMGKKLDFTNFTSEQLYSDIREVLENKSYLRNVLEFTEISQKTNGCQRAGRIISQYIN